MQDKQQNVQETPVVTESQEIPQKNIFVGAGVILLLILISVAVLSGSDRDAPLASRQYSQAYSFVNEKISKSVEPATVVEDKLILGVVDVTYVSTIDSELQDQVYGSLEDIALRFGYIGGAGIIMDIETGELLTLVSYPEFDSNGNPLVNRATNGLYAPGSAIKPFVAIAALSEGIINPEKEILSTGSIQIPIPFQEGEFSVFRDWKAHGYVDMRKAIGVSSNVYFYEIGGGFKEQEGLGIDRLEKYLRMFGMGSTTGINLISEREGTLPNPEWKEKEFNDSWRIGDTYLASIGQHGYEITPLQLLRATAAIANGGNLVTPTLDSNMIDQDKIALPVKGEHFEIVREGMEYAVTNGTALGLYLDGFTLAAKTGTVEVDIEKEFIHSWLIGYFPHDNPRYAFTFMLEQGPWGTEIGAVAVAEDIFKWIRTNRPEYYKK